MKELGITQKFLAKATGISEAKISRIMRDSTEPGDSFEWTEPDINNISIVLQWGTQGDINYEARGSPHRNPLVFNKVSTSSQKGAGSSFPFGVDPDSFGTFG